MKISEMIKLPFQNTIQARLIAWVIAMMAPMTALWGWYAWTEARDAEYDNYAKVGLLVASVASHITQTLKDYEGLTVLLAKEYHNDHEGWSTRFNPEQFIRLHPGSVSLGIYRPTSPSNPSSPQHETALRQYMGNAWNARAQSPVHFGVSGAIWEEDAQRWVTILTQPIHAPDGQRTGLIYLTLDLQRMNTGFPGIADPSVVISVLGPDSRFLMRSVEPKNWIGKTLPASLSALFKDTRSGNFTTLDVRSERRLYSMQTLEGSGWRVFAGVRETDALGSARAKAVRIAVLGLFTLLVMLMLARWRASAIAGPIRELALSVDRVQFDPSHRAASQGPAEVANVAQQFNALLDRIERQQQERSALTRHYGSIINNARDFIFLMDESRQIVEVNTAVLASYGYTIEELRRMTADDLSPSAARKSAERDWDSIETERGGLFESVHQRKDGSTFFVEVSANPIEVDGKTYRQAFVRDISERKLYEQALARQTRALIALSACNHALIGANTIQTLLDQVCDVIVKTGGYRLAWVGKPENDAQQSVSVWAKSGESDAYLAKLHVSWADAPLGRGPLGTAVREGRTVVAHNLMKNPDFEPWREAASKAGFASTVVIPLIANGALIATLAIYATDENAFDSTELDLLEDLASNLSYGVAHLQTSEHDIDLQAQLGASERRFQMLIEQSPSGIYVIRDGAFVYSNPRMDAIMGYPCGELMGQRPIDLVLAEDWHILRTATEHMNLTGSTGNIAVRGHRKDGVTIEIGLQNVTADYEGQPSIIGMAQDISERNRAQAEIQQYILKLERTTESTLQAVSAMVEKRDPYTAGHERRVGELAGAIGTEMGLTPHQVKGLRLAGFVHDLGKIAVPAELLAKPTRLTEIEMALIRVHSQAGYDVLKDIEFPWPIADVILQHHERLDGTGYPRGLIGKEILLEARIMMVADVVESMSSHRPYRPGLGIKVALAEVTDYSGVRYDPEVVKACQRLFLEKDYHIVD